jgi:hypothetical protein
MEVSCQLHAHADIITQNEIFITTEEEALCTLETVGVSSKREKSIKLYNDQINAQDILFFYLFNSVFRVSGFLLAHLQWEASNFSSGSSLLDMVSAPER